MGKGIFEGVSGVTRKTKNAFVGSESVSRKVKNGHVGVDNVAREFYRNEYESFYDAYQNGAITSLVTVWESSIDDGEEWDQSCFVDSYIPSSENTFDRSVTLASQSTYKSSSGRTTSSGLYFFCPTLEDAKMVAEMVRTKYTTVKGYDTYSKKYFEKGYFTIEESEIQYSTDICANTGLKLGYWKDQANGNLMDYYWNAYEADGYSDKYYVFVFAGYFEVDWDDEGDYAGCLYQIIFS